MILFHCWFYWFLLELYVSPQLPRDTWSHMISLFLLSIQRWREKSGKNKIITPEMGEEMEKWQVKEKDKHLAPRHAAGPPGSDSLPLPMEIKTFHMAVEMKWKPRGEAFCSLYPSGVWEATKPFPPPAPRILCRQHPGSWLIHTDGWCVFDSDEILFCISLFLSSSAGSHCWVCGCLPPSHTVH